MEGVHGALSRGLDRRAFLAGSAVMAWGGPALGEKRAATTGLIDVHHHVRPPNASEALMKIMPDWSAESAIAGMDQAGIATGIAWAGSLRAVSAEVKRDTARRWNEFVAGLGQSFPGRFGHFASLPFPDVDSCLAEIEFAQNHLHVDGYGIATSYDELWLGDESFWPIYDALNRHNAVVFVHPNDASCCTPEKLSYMRGQIEGAWIEWPMNTARTILSLMTSGTLRRFPRIRFIFCHGGGVMPLLIERLAGFSAWRHVGEAGLAQAFPDGIENEFRQLHFECAQACSATNMSALRSLVPDSQILFGSDFPFFPLPYGAGKLSALNLPPETFAAISRGNAARLLPRWA